MQNCCIIFCQLQYHLINTIRLQKNYSGYSSTVESHHVFTAELCDWFKIQIGPPSQNKRVIFSANQTQNQDHQ